MAHRNTHPFGKRSQNGLIVAVVMALGMATFGLASTASAQKMNPNHRPPAKKTVKKKPANKAVGERATIRTKKKMATYDNYATVGLGFVDHVKASGSDDAEFAIHPSIGFNMGNNLSLEIGVIGVFADSEDVTTNPDGTTTNGGGQGLELGGFNGAAKYEFRINRRVRAYGLAGLGFYSLGDPGGEMSPALDIGAGIDYRVSNEFNVGGRGIYNVYVSDNNSLTTAPGEPAPSSADATWSLMATVTYKF